MKGSLINRNGHYSVVLEDKDPVTGKRKQKWISVKGNRREAERQMAEMVNAKNKDQYIEPGKVTLADYLNQWLKDHCQPNLAPRSTEEYAKIARLHVIPKLGNLELAKLKPEHLQKLYADKLKSGRADGKGGLSRRSVQYIHITMHKALKTAVKMGMITRNVADAVEPPKAERREMHTMSESDLHIFLEYAKATPYYDLFYLMLFTGLRRSEALALRWSDVDLPLCQLSVNRTVQQMKDIGFDYRPPKTAKSRRSVALSPSTALVLKSHREAQESARQKLELPPLADEDLVFSHFSGKPFSPDSVTHAWIDLANRTGLKGIRLHDARHTHASLMLKQGVHPKIVQERLGHASIQITLDTYSHVAPGLQQAAANRFDEIVTGNTENQRIGTIRR